jgi:hypothetical protein
MSSSSFDVESANMGEGSSEGRIGLDEAGVEEVRRIMAVERCNFDQARLIRHNRHLAKNGIAPDGKVRSWVPLMARDTTRQKSYHKVVTHVYSIYSPYKYSKNDGLSSCLCLGVCFGASKSL